MAFEQGSIAGHFIVAPLPLERKWAGRNGEYEGGVTRHVIYVQNHR